MRYSIIIGLYKHQKNLSRLIESLNNQTFKNFEVHFCSDGENRKDYDFSSCNFKWEFHRLWFHRGMRLAKNLNQGIKAAKGEYCIFVMGDSFPELNYLEILNDWVGLDRILCGIRANVDGKKMIGLDWRLQKGLPQEIVMLTNNPWMYITGNGLTVPAEAFKKYGGWNENFQEYGGDDQELITRLYYKGYIVWSVPQAILYHNYHKPVADNEKSGRLFAKLLKQYAG